MAKIGMKHAVYAPITAEPAGSAITYGTGAVVSHAIAADVTYNRRDNPLYGDDIKIENDKGVTDYTISFEGDDLSNAVRVGLLGEKEAKGSGNTVTHYEINDENPPYVGFGYIRILLVDNTKIFEAFWYHKVQFGLQNDNASTKAENIEWGTYTIEGTGFGVELDNTGTAHLFDRMQFATEAAAKSWIDARANISA